MQFLHFRRLDWLVTLCFLTLLGYFGWQGFLAPHGFAYLDSQRAILAQKQKAVADLRRQRISLDQRVSLVRLQSLDPDMLDELARNELGWVGRNDIVVPLVDRNP